MKGRTWMAGLFSLVLAGVSLAQPAAAPAARPVAVVNGVEISRAELEAVMKTAEPMPVHLTEAQRRKRQLQALAALIDNTLMRQFLDKNTPPVADTEVARRLEEMELGLRDQGKSLAEFCQDTNQTAEQLRANVADHLRWNAYLATNVTDEAVARYYAENKDFFDEVTVRVSHILIWLPANATETEKAKARQTLEKVKLQLQSDPKADFAELANKFSQDPQASKGGDLGWIPRRWLDEAFSRAAFALQVGQVSDVVQTDFGMHLIKVTDRKPGKPTELEKIKEVVREAFAEDLRQKILAEQREAASKAGKITVQLP